MTDPYAGSVPTPALTNDVLRLFAMTAFMAKWYNLYKQKTENRCGGKAQRLELR